MKKRKKLFYHRPKTLSNLTWYIAGQAKRTQCQDNLFLTKTSKLFLVYNIHFIQKYVLYIHSQYHLYIYTFVQVHNVVKQSWEVHIVQLDNNIGRLARNPLGHGKLVPNDGNFLLSQLHSLYYEMHGVQDVEPCCNPGRN